MPVFWSSLWSLKKAGLHLGFQWLKRKGKLPQFLLLILESQHGKCKLQGSIMQAKTERGHSRLWNSFITQWHLLKESLVAKNLKGDKM